MSSADLSQIKPLLIDYVEKSSDIVDLRWDPYITNLQLNFDPYDKSEKDRIAHYFLQIAAIDTAELVPRSENARALMIFMYRALEEDLFEKGNVEAFKEVVKKANSYYKLGPSKDEIPSILDSVNKFVRDVAEGNLVEHSTKFSSPRELVKEISENIPYLGGQRFDHSWMYMRWMTRPYPDLNIFKNFSIKDLEIPLTSFVRNVAFCLGLCSTQTADWNNPEVIDSERRQLTSFALELFPEDPTIVDYPFYMLGRWIDDEKLDLRLLKDHLLFWQEIYQKLQMSPIVFEVASRYKQESSFEQDIRIELEKLKAVFKFEPYLFQLPKESGIPHYRPDFLLPNHRKKGREIILEPHGIWTQRENRWVTVGNRRYLIWAFPGEVDVDEERFVNKLRVFRENYKKMYYLILIVPSRFKERVEREYPEIYDEIYEDRDIPKILYNLKHN